MSVVRSTISFQPQNWKKIACVKNRSKLVNKALEYYFTAQDFLKKKEEEFILQELGHYRKTGERYSLEKTLEEDII